MDDVIANWILNSKSEGKASDEIFAAWEAVNDAVIEDPDSGWELVLQLVEAAPDNAILANVAAGPLEDLIRLWSSRLIDRLEVQARRDPKFRRCLTGVLVPSEVPPAVAETIAKYTSTVLDPL